MVVKRQCSFCAAEIEPGTGSMFVKRDGTVYHFCSSSCRKQQLHLGRVGHRFKWTRAHSLKVSADRASPPKTVPAPASDAAPAAPRKPARSRSPPAPAAPTGTASAVSPAAPTPPASPAPAAAAGEPAPAAPAKRTRPRKKPPAADPPAP